MNWLILVLDILFALVAAILGILGLGTFKSIKHLGIGKSFWVPLFLSGILFVLGSAVRVFHAFAVEYGWLATTYTEEVTQVSWLLAIGILSGSIYSYSRKVKIAVKFTTPEAQRENELKGLNKQTADLLKQIEKLKAQNK